MLQDRPQNKKGNDTYETELPSFWILSSVFFSFFLTFQFVLILLIKRISFSIYIIFSFLYVVKYTTNPTLSQRKKTLIGLRISRLDLFTWLLKHRSPYGSQEMGTFLYATVLVNNVVSQKIFKILEKNVK